MTPAMLERLGFDRQERRLLFWGGIALFLSGWADVFLQNVSEAYFLDEVGPHRLPYVFLASSALMVVTTAWMGNLAARQRRLRMLPRVLVGLGAVILPLWALIELGDVPGSDPSRPLKSVFGLLVIASKQVQSISLLVFWLAVNDLVNGRQAKRVYAPLTAGFTLGVILGSFASDNVAAWLGVGSLVPIATVALWAAAAATLPLRRGLPDGLRRRGWYPSRSRLRGGPSLGETADSSPVSLGTLWRESRLFRLLLLTGLFAGTLAPMLYFEFQWVAFAATEGEDSLRRLLELYAAFRGWVNLAILVAQLTAVSSLYRWIGIPAAVALSPVVYLLGFGGLSIRLALPVGVVAMATAKLQDNAVYDPAMRVLYNLFPDRMRARATGLLDGPVKRGAGALGNLLVIAALVAASQHWVGYAGMAISLCWIGVAWVLWREYPRLLLAATTGGRGSELETHHVDRSTVRALGRSLRDPDPRRCAGAIALVEEAHPSLAVPALARALAHASPATRPLLVAGLERCLDRATPNAVADARALSTIEAWLADGSGLSDLDRARLVHVYGRLVAPERVAETLEQALADDAPAVRLAAAAALGSDDLDGQLASAVGSEDPGERTIARRELRASLLGDVDEGGFEERLRLLASLLNRSEQRRAVAQALAEVAERHHEAALPVAETLLALRDDDDPQVRAAVMRFAGAVGREDQAGWLLAQLVDDDSVVAEAARDGLAALGSRVTPVLLAEASYGRRSKRNAILPLLRELRPDPEELWRVYEQELARIRRIIPQHHAMDGQAGFALVAQRLDERLDEGIHTALLLLATLRDRSEFEALAEHLPGMPVGRSRATLLEALEQLMGSREKDELLPLLDEDLERRQRRALEALGIAPPSFREVLVELLASSDELTRRLTAESLRISEESHDGGPLRPLEVALLLKGHPWFEDLTTAQLMDLVPLASEVRHPAGVTVVDAGVRDACMYLVVEGRVEVRQNGQRLATLGPDEFFGESSVFDDEPHVAEVVTCEPTRLLCIQRDDLLRLMEELPTVPILMFQTLSRRVSELMEGRASG